MAFQRQEGHGVGEAIRPRQSSHALDGGRGPMSRKPNPIGWPSESVVRRPWGRNHRLGRAPRRGPGNQAHGGFASARGPATDSGRPHRTPGPQAARQGHECGRRRCEHRCSSRTMASAASWPSCTPVVKLRARSPNLGCSSWRRTFPRPRGLDTGSGRLPPDRHGRGCLSRMGCGESRPPCRQIQRSNPGTPAPRRAVTSSERPPPNNSGPLTMPPWRGGQGRIEATRQQR